MGFLDGIRDVVGGFNAVKRIDDTGFDWREQDAAQQFARDRQVEEARQQDEDRAVNQIADAYAGAEGGQEPDVSPLLQGIEQRRQKFMLDRARGVGKERKSALEDQRRYREESIAGIRSRNALDVVGARGDEQQEAIQLREKLARERTLSPADQARLNALEKMNADRIAAGDRRAASVGGGAGGHRKVLKIPGTRGGVSGTVIRDQDTYEELGFEPSPTTAATRGKEEARGAAMKAYEAIRGLRAQMPTPEDWMEAGVTGVGRQIGAMTQANPVANRYKASIRGFVPLMARALGHVGVLTELDVERTEDLFSGLGATAETDRISDDMLRKIMSGEVPFQFGQGGGKPIAYVDESGNIEEYGGQRPDGRRRTGTPPPTGGGDDRTIVMFGGKKYRKKAGVTTNRRADYEEIP